MKKRYRYIITGGVLDDDLVSDYRLLSGKNIPMGYNGMKVVRIEIPEDLILDKSPYSPYSTTYDKRKIGELNPTRLVYRYGKLKQINDKI